MAGEKDILDMSMFSFSEEQTQTEEEKPLEQEIVDEKKEETKEEDIKIISVDDESQEVVDEPEEEKAPEKEEQNSESPADSDDVFKPLAEFLKEQGFFPNLDKEIKTADELAEAFKEEIKRNELAGLNEVQKQYLEALSSGVPDKVFHEHIKTSQVFKSVTDEILDESEDIRKQLIVQDLISSGIPEERALKQYQRIYDVGESLEEAKLARENLIKKEETEYNQKIETEKLSQENQAKLASKQIEDLKKAVYAQDKLFDTFSIQEGLKNKVYETMTKVVDHDEYGNPLNALLKHRMENPIDFETKLYYLYELTNGFKDITKFVTKSTTTAAKKLRDAVNSSTFIKSGGNPIYEENREFTEPPIVDINY